MRKSEVRDAWIVFITQDPAFALGVTFPSDGLALNYERSCCHVLILINKPQHLGSGLATA